MATQIKLGDMVELKSGGPRMTVDYVNNDGLTAYCIWFDKDKKRHRELFSITSLKNAEDGGIGVA